MKTIKKSVKVLSNEAVRKLVAARLAVLSSDTILSLGDEGSFTRDELIASVESGDRIGEKLAEIQMEWLRSFKDQVAV
ncbi:MAG: hypothetical protein V1763_00210 [Parcubacteria group bacterium]